MIRILLVFLVILTFAFPLKAQEISPQLEIQLPTSSTINFFNAAWNADETQLLVWGTSTAAYVYDATSGAQLFALPHEFPATSDTRFSLDWVTQGAWNANGTQILTTGGNEIRIWDAATGTRQNVIVYNGDETPTASWSPNSNEILAFTKQNTASIINANTGEKRLIFDHEGEVLAAQWSPNGTYIFTLSTQEPVLSTIEQALEAAGVADETVSTQEMIDILKTMNLFTKLTVWDTQSGEQIIEIINDMGQIYIGEWSTDGNSLVIIKTGDVIGVLVDLMATMFGDLIEGQELQPPDGNSFLEDLVQPSTLQVWYLPSQQANFTVELDMTLVTPKWNNDETRLFAASLDKLFIWDTATQALIQEIPYEGILYEADWNLDGTQIYTMMINDFGCGLDCNQVWVNWDTETGSMISNTLMPHAMNSARQWNPQMTMVASAGTEISLGNCTNFCDHPLFVFNAAGEQILRVPHPSDIRFILWDKSGKRLLSIDELGVLRIWQV